MKFLLVLVLWGFAASCCAEPGFSPIFPDSPSPFRDDDFRGGRRSPFPPSTSPYYRPSAPSFPGSRWEQTPSPSFENAFPLDNKTTPSAPGVYLRPVEAKSDLIIPLKLIPRTTVASVSTNCKTNTMNNAAYSFNHYYRFGTVSRHSTVDGVYANIEKAPAGSETFILSAHGNAGFIGAFDIKNVQELGKRLRKKGFKKIILGTCSAAWGEQGEKFVYELANSSQAMVIAWDQPVYMFANTTYLKDGGHLIIAVPEPETDEPAKPADEPN